MNLQENIQRIKQMMGIINESSYEEGWELVGHGLRITQVFMLEK